MADLGETYGKSFLSMIPFLERKDANHYFHIIGPGTLQYYIGNSQGDIFEVDANSRCLPQTMRVCVNLKLEIPILLFEMEDTVFAVNSDVVIYFESPTLKNFANFRLLLWKKLESGSEGEPKIAFAIPCINKGRRDFLRKTFVSQNLWMETPYFFRGPPPENLNDASEDHAAGEVDFDSMNLSQQSIPTTNTQGASPVPNDGVSVAKKEVNLEDEFVEIRCPTTLEMYWGRQSRLRRVISFTKRTLKIMDKHDQELEEQRAKKLDGFLGV